MHPREPIGTITVAARYVRRNMNVNRRDGASR
jgi:hypothetical protein